MSSLAVSRAAARRISLSAATVDEEQRRGHAKALQGIGDHRRLATSFDPCRGTRPRDMVHGVTSLRVRKLALTTVFLGAVFLVIALNRGRPEERGGAGAAPPGFAFREVAHQVGIDFVHHAPTLDPRIDNIAPLVASLGASVSVSDVNNDGWPDLYFTNSRFGFPNALYVNRGDGTFVDVASSAGLADLNRPGEGVSMGAVWGDYDNDGLEDVLVYKWGYLQLFKNLGNLHFEDVTAAAGLRHWMNSNGAVWLDYDRDGLLDLYVTDRMGVGSTRWTLAAAAADLNGDGWPDLFLANDYGPEELFVNDSGWRFVLTKAGLESDSKSGMSASLGDVLNRGRLDAFVTNISERGYLFQGNNLRLNFLPELGRFQQGAEGVIADAGWAWGAQLGDLDNDGRNELFIVNGYVSGDRNRSYWYAASKIAGAYGPVFEDARSWPAIGTASLSGYERSRVLVNRGLAGWRDVAAQVGVTDEYDGRAVVLVDLFNRGVVDVVVANQKQPALVYKNTVAPGNNWIAFKLVGTRSNRSAIGAEVTVEFGAERQLQIVHGGVGFASQNDRRLHFGLGRTGRADRVMIRWPSGTMQTIEDPAVDQLHIVTEPRPDA